MQKTHGINILLLIIKSNKKDFLNDNLCKMSCFLVKLSNFLWHFTTIMVQLLRIVWIAIYIRGNKGANILY